MSVLADKLQWLSCVTGRFSIQHTLRLGGALSLFSRHVQRLVRFLDMGICKCERSWSFPAVLHLSTYARTKYKANLKLFKNLLGISSSGFDHYDIYARRY